MRSLNFLFAACLLGFTACAGQDQPAVDAAGPGAQPAADAADLETVFRNATAAHAAGEHERFLELSLQVESLLSEHPRLIYNSACGFALTGQSEAALARLDRLARMEIVFDLEADEDLNSLHQQPRFRVLVQTMAEAAEPIERSSVAFTVPDPTFLVEGVAHDPATGDMLLSSLYQRRIVRVTPDHRVVDLTAPSDTLWSMLGMVVCPGGECLWTITVASPRMRDGAPDQVLQSALVKLSLIDGAEIARFEPPDGVTEAALDSLAVARDGAVYVSDSGAGAVYLLRPGTSHLEILAPPKSFRSTQGLALSADERFLYAADYSRGISAIEVADGSIHALSHDGASLLGIDGLERHGSDLIAIQNGVRPNRVVRIVLSPDGLAIEGVELLERAHHLYREPTLGTVVGDDLLYVASSQWRSFDEEGTLLRDQLVQATILRLPL